MKLRLYWCKRDVLLGVYYKCLDVKLNVIRFVIYFDILLNDIKL